MKANEDKIDDVVLALLQLTVHEDYGAIRAWKGQSWEVLDRLHQKGWIADPKGKAKSVVLTEEGAMRSEMLFHALFVEDEAAPVRARRQKIGGVRLRISLRGSDPEIWRVIAVPEDLCLGDLHALIQIVMGWENSHPHQFQHKGVSYGVPSPDDRGGIHDEDDVCMADIFLRKGSRLEYEYDFGDSWMHDVVSLGKTIKDDVFFQVTDGAMACPPEDCGGIWGYYQFVEAIRDKKHPEHHTYLDWIGGPFDPAHFDPDAINRQLDKVVVDPL